MIAKEFAITSSGMQRRCWQNDATELFLEFPLIRVHLLRSDEAKELDDTVSASDPIPSEGISIYRVFAGRALFADHLKVRAADDSTSHPDQRREPANTESFWNRARRGVFEAKQTMKNMGQGTLQN